MSRWLARLSGEVFDLEELPRRFPSGRVHAVCENGTYCLIGPDLEGLQSESDVRAAAESALRRFTAIVSLRLPSFRKPDVDAIIFERDDGSRATFISAVGRIEARSKLHAVAEVIGPDGRVTPAPTSTPEQELLEKSDGHSALESALTLWADQNRTWPRLYRILEEIEKHLGQRVDVAGMCTAAQRQRFARTANSAEVAGADARHAAGRFAPPANPMTSADGSDFVRSMLLKAVEGA